MDMAIIVIARLVFGTIHQTVSHHEPQLDEEMHCIIERSSAHPEVSLRELSIQLKAGKRSENASSQIKLGRYTLDANHATLKDTQEGSEKMLTAREAKILELLAVNKNEVVRREAVLSRFWGVEDKDYFASRSLDVFIKKIRTALEDEPAVELKTIRGVGFKLIAE